MTSVKRENCRVVKCFQTEYEFRQSMHPIQSNVNKRAQVFLFARIFYNITFIWDTVSQFLHFQLQSR